MNRAFNQQALRPFISLSRATFRLGERLVFENSDWVFHYGEHWAVRGPNGSGKSLLADALRSRLPLVGGTMRFHFRPPKGLLPEESIGHASFEERRLDAHGALVQSRWNSLEEDGAVLLRDFLSYENVLEINPFAVTSNDAGPRRGFERRRRAAVTLLGLEPLKDRALLSLSNGERQRAQLARALCHPLRLLILDEPFTGLDRQARSHFHAALRDLMRTSLRLLVLTTRDEDVPSGITHVLELEDCAIARARAVRGKSGPAPGPCREERRKIEASRQTSQPLSLRNRVPLVSLREVTVRYGSKVILDRLNWDIWEGESWALVGANGSGKTTLLSLLNGDNPQAYSNSVKVFGKLRGAGESIWELKQQIGCVSPEEQVYFDTSLTCFEAVASGFFDTNGLFERLNRNQRRAAWHWLREFELADYAQTSVAELSAGTQRLVLLARCLVKRPRLLVLDEPCQGLDLRHRRDFLRKINALIVGRVTTVIFVTHRQEEIPASIKRVKFLDRRSLA